MVCQIIITVICIDILFCIVGVPSITGYILDKLGL
jgi:hypothetical protein